MTPKDWNRLRALVSGLLTEKGTQQVFHHYSGLGEAFSSEEFFCTFVAPWRPRLTPLPAAQQDAPDVDLEVRRQTDGTTTFLMTFHHQRPENAITILKSIWLDDNLLKVAFIKGFAQVPDNNANRNRRYGYEDYYRQRDYSYGGRR